MDASDKNENKTRDKNLVKFKKGNPGGPGRPPIAKCIPDLLRWSGGLQAPNQFVEKIRKFFNLPENTMITVDQACILRSRMEAMNGDANHLKFWAERAEGKVTDKLELSGGAKLEIVEEIVDANKN
jgi:hypothetical protein